MGTVRAHLLISGRVQGVFYRASAHEAAVRLGLTGWVRNVPNGDVEAEVEGPEATVDEFGEWCWKGPPSARVEDIEVQKVPASEPFHQSFVIRR